MEFKLCPLYSARQKGGRPQEETRIKGAIKGAIDKTEKKKKLLETQKKNSKREPIEPDDLVEYRSRKKKHKKEDKTMGKAMGKTVGKVANGNGGKQKSGYKKRVTQPTTTSPKKKKARRIK
jgi:hypothetical protein